MNVFLKVAAALAITAATGAQAAIIDFTTDRNANLSAGNYTQNGFTVINLSPNNTARLLNDNTVFGDILASGFAAGITSVRLVRSDGGLFSLNSFLGGSGSTGGTATYSLLGYLDSINTYSEELRGTATGSGLAAATFTLTPGPATNLFDEVTFTFSAATRSVLASAVIDNIDVTAIGIPNPVPPVVTPPVAAAVPEPATWAMMILGFGVVGAAMRRRPKVAVRFA